MQRPELNELSLKEKISQLLMINQYPLLQKTEVDERQQRSPEEQQEIMRKYQYGSLWATGNMQLNVANMAEINIGYKTTTGEYKAWIDRISEPVRLPMLVGTDCEGGGGVIFSDATHVSSALAIGAAKSAELAFELGADIAREIKAAGCNWRWSPILDIPNRFNGSVGRSFSDDPRLLAELAIAHMKGMQSEGVAATAKHFPGADPYEFRDSHIVTTALNISFEEWEKTQAMPFQKMIDAGVYTVMIGHAAFPAADNTMLNGRVIPASMSEKIIEGILRKRMGFQGVVITDGITMAGLTSMCDYEEMLIRLINAGNDILLGVNPTDYEIVEKAVEEGKISMERIDSSCKRVLELKEKLGLFHEERRVPDILECAEKTRRTDEKIAEKAVTVLCNNGIVPLRKEEIKKVALICSTHRESIYEKINVMVGEFEKRGAKTDVYKRIESKEKVKELSDNYDLIVYAAFVAQHNPMGMPSLYGDEMLTYFNAFSFGKEKSVGVAMGYPYLYHDTMQGAQTFFNIYSSAPNAQIAFVKTLYGEIPLNTHSPIDIVPKLRYIFS